MDKEILQGKEMLALTGKTIAFEGIQGAGKTTAIEQLEKSFSGEVPVHPVNVRRIRETVLLCYETELNERIHKLMEKGQISEATKAAIAKTTLVRDQLKELYPTSNSVYLEDRSIDTSFIYDTYGEYADEIFKDGREDIRWDELSSGLQQRIIEAFRIKLQTAIEMGYNFPDLVFYLYCEDQVVAHERDQSGSTDPFIVQDLYDQYYALYQEMVPDSRVVRIETATNDIDSTNARVIEEIRR